MSYFILALKIIMLMTIVTYEKSRFESFEQAYNKEP